MRQELEFYQTFLLQSYSASRQVFSPSLSFFLGAPPSFGRNPHCTDGWHWLSTTKSAPATYHCRCRYQRGGRDLLPKGFVKFSSVKFAKFICASIFLPIV